MNDLKVNVCEETWIELG